MRTNMNKRNKGISLILLLIIIVICIIIVMVGVIAFYKINNKNSKNEVIINNDVPNTNKITADNKIVTTKKDLLNNWNGIYENENYAITLYRISENKLDIIINNIKKENFKVNTNLTSIDLDFNISTDMYTLNITSDTNIDYNQNLFGEVSNISIEKTINGIKINSSSTKEDSILNECSGEYTKKEFKNANWDGVYKNGDNVIVLAQYEEKTLYITLNESWCKYTQDFDDIIEINEESFGKTENLKITKTQTGIEVEAISNEEGSLLEGINGSYIKQ